jgi:hypothetical protein
VTALIAISRGELWFRELLELDDDLPFESDEDLRLELRALPPLDSAIV